MAIEMTTIEPRHGKPAEAWPIVEREFRQAKASIGQATDDKILDRFCAAREQMLNTPAPDLAALNLKLQLLLESDDSDPDGYSFEWRVDLLGQARIDCRRLLTETERN